MRTKVLPLLFVLATLSCFAQEKDSRFGIELNGGPSIAIKKVDDAKMKVGLGFEGIFHYRFYDYMGVYAGWGWNQFSSKESFMGKCYDFDETGYVLGLQFKHPIGNSPVSYYLRAGGLYNHIEIENSDGEIVKDTKHGFGYQLAGGINIPVSKKWSIITGLRFNSLKRCNIEFSDYKRTLDLKYLSLRIGIVKMF